MGFVITACSQNVENYSNNAETSRSLDRANSTVAQHEKLGTKWGDELNSRVYEVDLSRVTSEPIAQASLRYANKNFTGKAVNNLSIEAGRISFTVIDDQGKTLPIVRDGENYYVQAKDGQAYQLHYQNHSQKTYEIVASVDGIDVLNGQAASKYNSGYVLNPNTTLTIDGFRKSKSTVASFIFAKPQDAYAANTSSGSISNTGIIATVVYELKKSKKVNAVNQSSNGYAPAPNAFPAD